MPWLMQMAGCAGMILFLALTLWIGFWVLLVLGTLSLCVACYRYLVRKGILNPIPATPSDSTVEEETITIIEGEFQHIEEKKDER